MTPLEVAHGFIDVANESMSRPIRALTEARGFETGQHNLATFGGAGGQHACEIGKKLGIRRIVIHKYSSILSAYGMALAEVVQEAQEPSSEILSEESLKRLLARMTDLKAKVTEGLLTQGIQEASIEHEQYLNLRYQGTDTNFMILAPFDGDWRSALEKEHLRELSFVFPKDKKVHIDDVRVRGVGKSTEVSNDNSKLVKELKSPTFSEVQTGEDRTVRPQLDQSIGQSTSVILSSSWQDYSMLTICRLKPTSRKAVYSPQRSSDSTNSPQARSLPARQ